MTLDHLALLGAIATGSQMLGAIMLVKGTLLQDLRWVYNRGEMQIGSFTTYGTALARGARGELSRWLHGEWTDTLAGFLLIFIGFAIDLVARLAAGGPYAPVLAGFAVAGAIAGATRIGARATAGRRFRGELRRRESERGDQAH